MTDACTALANALDRRGCPTPLKLADWLLDSLRADGFEVIPRRFEWSRDKTRTGLVECYGSLARLPIASVFNRTSNGWRWYLRAGGGDGWAATEAEAMAAAEAAVWARIRETQT